VAAVAARVVAAEAGRRRCGLLRERGATWLGPPPERGATCVCRRSSGWPPARTP